MAKRFTNPGRWVTAWQRWHTDGPWGSAGGSVVKPNITGDLSPGGGLTVTDGYVPGYTKSTTQWLVSYDGGVTFDAIGGATTDTYTVPAGDWQAIYKVTNTFSNGVSAYDNDSDPTDPIGGDDTAPVWDFSDETVGAAVYDGNGTAGDDTYDGGGA